MDERRVGSTAADGLDGVDEVLLVALVDGANKAQTPGAREKLDPLIVLPALATATVAPVRAASKAAQRPAMPDPITSTSVDSIGFLSRPAHCRTGDRQWGRKDSANR